VEKFEHFPGAGKMTLIAYSLLCSVSPLLPSQQKKEKKLSVVFNSPTLEAIAVTEDGTSTTIRPPANSTTATT